MTILTPDQRIRVFISSTHGELESEREAARRAIASMRLTPVALEQGARPHPPRTLYRSYLEQSHVFLGIYWESYGWVAEDMDISGLEDESSLAEGKPKLVYVKEPAPDRDPRLRALLDRIREENVSYKSFSNPSELERLIADDLALLLSESFELPAEHIAENPPLPQMLTRFIGRERDVDAIEGLLEADDVRLVTLTGPGGVGKTRLAIEVASRYEKRLRDGVRMIGLASLHDPGLVPESLAQSMGLTIDARGPLAAFVESIADREMLIVLDNYEHLLPAADQLAVVLQEAPEVKLLVTSRALLRLRGEHEYPVPPMALPNDASGLEQAEATRLFLDRTEDVRRDAAWSDEDRDAILEIARRLDGLPLALELAAARVRVLPPHSLLGRLSESFGILTGERDMPERHQTLQDTITWSYELLDENARKLFRRLGVFVEGFSLNGAEEICALDDVDVIEGLSTLIDHSLVHSATDNVEDQPRFSMLETVREYSCRLLSEDPDEQRVREALATSVARFAHRAAAGFAGTEQDRWLDILEMEVGNLRLALEWSLANGRPGMATEIGWDVWLFWWIRGYLGEGRSLMGRALEGDDLTPLQRARALAVRGAMAFWQGDYGSAVPDTTSAIEGLVAGGDERGTALCNLVVGLTAGFMGDEDQGKTILRDSLEVFTRLGDRWGRVISLNALCWLIDMRGVEHDPDTFELHQRALEEAMELGTSGDRAMANANMARYHLYRDEWREAAPFAERGIRLFWQTRYHWGAAYLFDVIAELEVHKEAFERAAWSLGVGEMLRERSGAPVALGARDRMEGITARIVDALGPDRFAAEKERAREASLDDAIEGALKSVGLPV